MNVMKSGLVSTLLLCACVLVNVSATKHHHGSHKHKKSSTTEHNLHLEHHHSNHKKSGTIEHKTVEHIKSQHDNNNKKNSTAEHKPVEHIKSDHKLTGHHHSNHKKTIIAKHVLKHSNHDHKKSDIPDYNQLSKKFDITAHPQQRPDMMTVVMKGLIGMLGMPGPQGDAGSPGLMGAPGPVGDRGLPGVCSRTQCENEQLKSLIQRLLALEKFVNNSLKNKKNTTNNKTNSGNNNKGCNPIIILRKPGFNPCRPSPLLAIVPLFKFTKPRPAPATTPQAKATAQVQAGQNPTQGLTNPKVTASLVSVTPTAAALRKPSPTGTAPPTGPAQRLAATPPPSPFYITLQGVTSYDAPFAIPPQQQTQVSYVTPQYKTVPANWVTSGSGPIDLKSGSLYRRTYAKTPSEQAFYSPHWSYNKRQKIFHHDLLTHKLANKMMKTSTKKSATTKSTKKSAHHQLVHNTKENTRHHVTKTTKKKSLKNV